MGNAQGGMTRKKGVRYDASGGVVSCVFCKLGQDMDRRVTRTFHDDDEFYVMESRTTYARQHLLVRNCVILTCVVTA